MFNKLLYFIKYSCFNEINIIIILISYLSYKNNNYIYKKSLFIFLSIFGYIYSGKFFILDNFLFGKRLFLGLILFTTLTDIIENSIYTFSSLLIGFFGITFLMFKKFNHISRIDGLLTFIFSLLFFYIIYIISKKNYKKEVFGQGDVIIIPFLGFYLGHIWLIWTILIASILGSIYGIIKYIIVFFKSLKIKKPKKQLILIPFIPFLYLGLSISHKILYEKDSKSKTIKYIQNNYL